jgi:uncharacterized lipoprotein YehR (DUF1307 family)
MKRILSLMISIILILIFVFSLTGCNSNKPDDPERVKQIALDYLHENYPDDTFTALGYSGENFAYDYKIINFQSEKYLNYFEVRLYDEDDVSEYIIEDEYFKLAMKEDAEKYFTSIASKYYDKVEVKVEFSSLELPEEISKSTDFSEYVDSEKCYMEVYFISDLDLIETDINSLLSDIKDRKIEGHFKFLLTTDEDLLKNHCI